MEMKPIQLPTTETRNARIRNQVAPKVTLAVQIPKEVLLVAHIQVQHAAMTKFIVVLMVEDVPTLLVYKYH